MSTLLFSISPNKVIDLFFLNIRQKHLMKKWSRRSKPNKILIYLDITNILRVTVKNELTSPPPLPMVKSIFWPILTNTFLSFKNNHYFLKNWTNSPPPSSLLRRQNVFQRGGGEGRSWFAFNGSIILIDCVHFLGKCVVKIIFDVQKKAGKYLTSKKKTLICTNIFLKFSIFNRQPLSWSKKYERADFSTLIRRRPRPSPNTYHFPW